jgi:prepilin-type N-terminal cleavage/methylation domain-containing protein
MERAVLRRGDCPFFKMKKGFTLLEALVTIVIISVLATIGMRQYSGQRELAMDKEASANLKLIQSAQRIYRMEFGGYIGCADTASVNTNLRLLLPTASASWNYKVDDAGETTYTGKARRTGGPRVRNWCIDQGTETPYTSGCSW